MFKKTTGGIIYPRRLFAKQTKQKYIEHSAGAPQNQPNGGMMNEFKIRTLAENFKVRTV